MPRLKRYFTQLSRAAATNRPGNDLSGWEGVLPEGLSIDRGALVSKLRGTRERKNAAGVKVEGRRLLIETHPKAVKLARQLYREGGSLREISSELLAEGHVNSKGRPFSAQSIKNMLEGLNVDLVRLRIPARHCDGLVLRGR